jgi:flap endonuclease GEN
MTVASLWSVLDEAGCGKAVGSEDIVERNKTSQGTNPWNYNEMNSAVVKAENRTTLAVDLSIWICEALTSTAMATNHSEPALHLVYTRTTRLLNMGIKLVVVVEGKRRVRMGVGEEDCFRKRRSGTAFWRACQACEDMLKTLGVPVVRAKAEGEALCALLNQRGIVDGVISNDGDCLLFGAKVVYTRFSIDNLDKKQVIRYDASELRGFVSDTEDDADANAAAHECVTSDENSSCVPLGRGDLISFALLTGSDLAGNGLPKVGHKKAMRFIRQCQSDSPLSPTTATIDELKSWARTAALLDGHAANAYNAQERCCSLCCHPGDKRGHERHGCEACGTKPGEPCFAASAGDKFRKALRAKALEMIPKFDPSFVMAAYMKPNDNQVPLTLAGETARSLRMSAPRFGDMMTFPHIIKGQTFVGSREYIKQSMARLLARTHLFNDGNPPSNKGRQKNRLSREQPIPVEITRTLVQNKVPCYNITWSVGATLTDSQGDGIDGYEFSTIEAQTLIETRHPDLVRDFLEREKEEAKQGDAEANRRRSFLREILDKNDEDALKEAGDDAANPRKKGRHLKRAGFFEKKRAIGFDVAPKNVRDTKATGSDDVLKLVAIVDMPQKAKAKEFDDSSIEDESGETDVDETKKGDSYKSKVPREIRIVHPQQDIPIFRPSEIHGGQAPAKCQTLQPDRDLRVPTTSSRYHEPLKQVLSFLRECGHSNCACVLSIQDVATQFCIGKAPSDDKRIEYQPRRKRDSKETMADHSGSNEHEQIKRARQSVNFGGIIETATRAPAGKKDYMTATSIPRVSFSPRQDKMPVLTPGCYHSMVCDMGIQIEVTPLVSSKQVRWV